MKQDKNSLCLQSFKTRSHRFPDTHTNPHTSPKTHTLSFSRFVTHLNTNKLNDTHKHTHTNTRLKLFLRSRHKHTHTYTITETTLDENLDRTNYTNTYYVSESQ